MSFITDKNVYKGLTFITSLLLRTVAFYYDFPHESLYDLMNF